MTDMRRTMCCRAGGFAAFLACWFVSAGSAWADNAIRMEIDPFDRAAARGVTIFDLSEVTVALFGSSEFDVRDIDRDALRLGTLDAVGARPLWGHRGKRGFPTGPASHKRHRAEDVDGDGFEDLLVSFRVDDIDLRKGEHVLVELQGRLRDGRPIRAFDGVIRSSDPIDSCGFVQSGGLDAGYRCTYTSSLEPIDWQSFLTQVNAALAGTTTFQITDDTPVVLEVWGGAGDDGNIEHCGGSDNPAKGGDGGAGGYASTVLTVADLQAQLSDQTSLYVYVGENSTQNQGGGSATLFVGQKVTGIASADITDPAGQFVLAIGGGGGGGGKGTCESDFDADRGYDGGAGGVATATTSAVASAAGSDGGNAHKGQGGNQDGDGGGGPANGDGNAGTDGIGGFGENAQTVWNGSSVGAADWTNGMGGEGGKNNKAGGGGGGFGGGGGGEADNNKGGGGGGGSWAMQGTIDRSEVDDNLIIGSAGDGASVAVFTFQLIPLSN